MSEGAFRETSIEFSGAEDNRLAGTLFEPQGGSEGPVVLLMHGGGQTRHSWNGTARQFAAGGLTAVTVDARGHGESEWLDSGHYSIHHFAEDLVAIARDLAGRFRSPPILVGASLGGLSAMLAQVEAGPDIFSAIVLVDITPRMQASGVDRITGFMGRNMREGFASVEEAADAIAEYLPHRKRPRSLDGLQKNLRQRQDGRWYWHWDPRFIDGPMPIGSGRNNRGPTLLDAARRISVPALLVRGRRSELVTEEAAREFLDLVPHAKYVDVSDAGHMVAGDSNEIFADAVMEFLETEMRLSRAETV